MLLKRIYFILAIAGIIYLSLLIYLTFQIIASGIDKTTLFESYYSYQSIISISNVILFFVLLALSGIIYYRSNTTAFLYSSGFIFVVFTIINHWYLAKVFYSISKNTGPLTNEYTLNLMLASFYCIGSIAITAITLITLKNLKNRNKK
ncbi:MAG: hypothetical protein GXO79_13510 [Chlorobi bacterium]|nr:hypothetical protein [Chlorobiota bacterium]